MFSGGKYLAFTVPALLVGTANPPTQPCRHASQSPCKRS